MRVCFTSNRPPSELYARGLNRKYFLPFVRLLTERCAVMRVGEPGDDALDYRTLPPPPSASAEVMRRMPAASALALAPRPLGEFLHGDGAQSALLERWSTEATDGTDGGSAATGSAATGAAAPGTPGGAAAPLGEAFGSSRSLPVAFGRRLHVRQTAGDACWFAFDDLCGAGADAMGAADFLALARAYRTVYLSGLPVLHPSMRNEARRFVVLIDALYEGRVRLLVAADASPEATVQPLLAASESDTTMADGAEVDVSEVTAAARVGGSERQRTQPSFAEAPVGGSFRVDGELAAFFTAKDEGHMLKRTLSRLTEMTSRQP